MQLLPFHGSKTWVKKKENPLFDVTLGSYNGTEVCKLVELYLLSKMAPLIGTSHQANVLKMDSIRKDVISLFKCEGLSITIDTNLIRKDFSDV